MSVEACIEHVAKLSTSRINLRDINLSSFMSMVDLFAWQVSNVPELIEQRTVCQIFLEICYINNVIADNTLLLALNLRQPCFFREKSDILEWIVLSLTNNSGSAMLFTVTA